MERGPFIRALVLAKATVDLAAGEQASLTLDLEAAPEIQRAGLAGELVIHPSWQLERFELVAIWAQREVTGDNYARELGHDEMKRLAPDRWAFEIPDLAVGQYILHVPETATEWKLELPPEGRRDLALEVPEPSVLRLKTVERGTGEPVPAVRVTATVKASHLSSCVTATASEPGNFELRVPTGDWMGVMASADGFGMPVEDVLVPAGTLDLQLEMTRGYLVFLHLRGTGKGYLPFPEDWDPEAALRGAGPEPLQRVVREEDGYQLYFTTKGVHRLELPEIQGYRRHAPLVIEVGRKAWYVVRLEPL